MGEVWMGDSNNELSDMISCNKERIYVAELKVPSYFYLSGKRREVRCAIPNPSGFEVSKGYWILRPQDEQSDVEGYAELVLIIEFVSTTLKDAENHALKVGSKFSSIVSAYGGYPLGSIKLHRIASIGVEGGLASQHNYWYGHKSYMLSEFNQTVEHQFQKYLQLVSSITDAKKRYQLQSAIHWYGIAISADDPTVSYVAAWTSLESIGTVLDSISHPHGSKALCKICGNSAGKDRDRKKAGINHIFNSVTKEALHEALSKEARELISNDLMDNFSSEYANKLRDHVVHGLKEVDALVQECSKFRRHLIHVLNASIQDIMGPSVISWASGHYEFHPGGRVSLKFKEGLVKSPYHGQWIEGFQYQTQPSVYSKETPYVATANFEWPLAESIANLVESKSEELFGRGADIFNSQSEPIKAGLTTWHDRPPEPVWGNFSISS